MSGTQAVAALSSNPICALSEEKRLKQIKLQQRMKFIDIHHVGIYVIALSTLKLNYIDTSFKYILNNLF